MIHGLEDPNIYQYNFISQACKSR